jgi:hypothetical protein
MDTIRRTAIRVQKISTDRHATSQGACSCGVLMMTVCRREILATLGVALTFAGATTVMAVAALSARGIDAELLKLNELKPVDAALSRELRRLPDKDDEDDDDDDDDKDDRA